MRKSDIECECSGHEYLICTSGSTRMYPQPSVLLKGCRASAMHQLFGARIADAVFAIPRKVSDTAQSIAFAIEGNVDGLQCLFSLGLASARDESYSRGFSLLRVGLPKPFPFC